MKVLRSAVVLIVITTFQQGSLSAPVGDALRELFNKYDNDDNSVLGTPELKSLLKELGKEVSDQDIEKDFGKGPVKFNTFNKAMDDPKYHSCVATYALQKMFQRHDKDKDGALGKEQMIAVMKELGFVWSDEDIENLFGKEPVKFDKFKEVLASPEFMTIQDHETDEEWRQMFDSYDANKDGEIGTDELKEILKNVGMPDVSDEELAQVMGSGTITFDRFKSFMENSNLEVDHTTTPSMTWDEVIEKLFIANDQDNNGMINTQEIKNLMDDLGTPMTEEEIIKDFGKDGVTLDKFKEVLSAAREEVHINTQERIDRGLKNMFDGHDEGHKGHLSTEELERLTNIMGLRMTREDVINEFGTDGATFEELKNFLSIDTPIRVRTEQEANDVLRINCKSISQGKDKFNKQDVLHYYKDILMFETSEEGIDALFKEADEKTGGFWTIDDCITHMRQGTNFEFLPDGQDPDPAAKVNHLQKYYLKETEKKE